jgi:hypothetical protein
MVFPFCLWYWGRLVIAPELFVLPVDRPGAVWVIHLSD